MRDADLPEARQDLARALGWPDIPQPIWEELVAYSRPDIEQSFGLQEWEDVATLAREIQAAGRRQASYKSPPGRAAAEDRPIWQLKDEELKRSWVFSEHVSRIAHTDDDVRRFRSKYLGADVIQPYRARSLLASPAAAIWPWLEFHVSGFSLLDHTYHVVEEGRDDKGRYVLVEPAIHLPAPENALQTGGL